MCSQRPKLLYRIDGINGVIEYADDGIVTEKAWPWVFSALGRQNLTRERKVVGYGL